MIFVSADVESKGVRILKPSTIMIKNVGTDIARLFLMPEDSNTVTADDCYSTCEYWNLSVSYLRGPI